MIDPADSVTHTLPQPARVQFRSDARVYTAVLDQDLFGDWIVAQSWAGIASRHGGGKITHVESHAAGIALLEQIAKRRARHGYQVVV